MFGRGRVFAIVGGLALDCRACRWSCGAGASGPGMCRLGPRRRGGDRRNRCRFHPDRCRSAIQEQGRRELDTARKGAAS